MTHNLEIVQDKDTAFDIMQSLEMTYQKRGRGSRMLLRRTLWNLKYNSSSEKIGEHFFKFDKLIRELKPTGATVEEDDVVVILFHTLPKQYRMLETALDNLPGDKLTLTYVKGGILEEEAKIQSRTENVVDNSSPITAFGTPSSDPRQSHSTVYKGKLSFNTNFKSGCFYCGHLGHKKEQCKKFLSKKETSLAQDEKANNEQPGGSRGPSSYVACSANAVDKIVCQMWYLGSGASDRLINDESLLSNVRDLSQPIPIRVAKYGTVNAKKIGNVNMISNGKSFSVKNVFFLPDLAMTLLSMSQDALRFEIIF